MTVAFSMYPTSIRSFERGGRGAAYARLKSTWFEPKLRSGLFIHRLGVKAEWWK